MQNRPEPFLFRFAKPCLAPSRAVPDLNYFYDATDDIVRWTGAEDQPPAVIRAGSGGPRTKKMDIEKGEDNKDRRMWR